MRIKPTPMDKPAAIHYRRSIVSHISTLRAELPGDQEFDPQLNRQVLDMPQKESERVSRGLVRTDRERQ